jgi:hypothetical protein
MRWPRGKYNGRSVTGLDISFRIDLEIWRWRPIAGCNFASPFVAWACFRLRIDPVYGVFQP